MAEKLRLKTGAGKHKVRLHMAVLVAIVIVSLAVGYVIGTKGVITGSATKGAIPASEFQYFLDKYNLLQEDYAGCVKDAWALQLACKTNIANKNAIITGLNSTGNSSN